MKIVIDNESPPSLEASVSGEVDADNCHELGAMLLKERDGISLVELNLRDVTFLDSSALSELLRIHNELSSSERALSVTGVSQPVRRVLEITGLLNTFGLS